jgi:hypothetical protein
MERKLNTWLLLQKLPCILIALLLVGCDRGDKLMATGNTMQPFAPGQVWTYNTRSGEEASRIVICRVETDPKLGQVVHIHVNGVRLKNDRVPGGFSDQIGHMPYSGKALRESLTKLESTGAALPDFEDGYQEWRGEFDKGKAGVWTAPVSEAIAAMESTMNQ